MKRYFALALVALFLVPVLAMPAAAAAEIYEFEYMEPVALYGEQFDFSLFDDDSFFCEAIIPPGSYVLHYKAMSSYKYITGVSEPFTISFVPFTEDGVSYDICQTSVQVCFDFECLMADVLIVTGENFGGSLMYTSFSVGPESFFILERIDGPSVSSDDFMAVFESVTDQISVSSAVSVLVYGTGGCVGMGFSWWGIRKGARMLMAAFRSGKFKL